jgi:hypothetical protein
MVNKSGGLVQAETPTMGRFRGTLKLLMARRIAAEEADIETDLS